jgi:hypothetical protein
VQLRLIADDDCKSGDCPKIYATNRGTIAVRGYTVTDHGLALPDGETIVEIPLAVLLKAAHADLA